MKIVEDAALDQKVQALLARIPQEVDKMVGQLKSSLINPMTRPQAKRGIWDRFKNTMSNLWWGRYNQDNPYFWKNKLGDDLGHVQPEHVMLRTIPIEEYRLFRNHCQLLEDQLNHLSEDTIPGTENLAIMRTIDQWATQLKDLLTKTIKDHIYGAGSTGPVSPVEAPDDEPTPAPEPASSEKKTDKLEPKDHRGLEFLTQKQELRKRLDALGGLIEDEAFDRIKKHIDEDEHDKAAQELSKYESENPEPASPLDEKKELALAALGAAKERGLPEDKYEAYKKAINGATDPATLDRVVAELSRTATIDSHEDDAGGPTSETLPPPEEDTGEDEGEDSEPGPTYSSYWDKKPNTGDLDWESLSPSQKAAWNNYGGGVQRRIAKKGLKGLVIPWILRIGDPRTDILYNRDRRHIWNELRNQERIELDNDPVKDRQDFEKRLENAKRLRQQYVDKLSRRGRKSDVEIEREKLSDDERTGVVDSPTPEVKDDKGTPPVTRTAEMPNDSLPPNMPNDQSTEREDRTHILDDIKPHDALEEIGKAKEDGIITDDEYDALTDLVMDDKITTAMKKLLRIKAAKEAEEGGDDIETFDWIAPQNVLREKVEYYKKLLREGTRCVR